MDSDVVAIDLVDALPSPAIPTPEGTLYPGALHGNVDMLLRTLPDGVEDHLFFDEPPPAEDVRYDVALEDGIAGLRLIADTVEFLDAAGTPQLRMAAPYIDGADGTRHWARTEITTCAHDVDPRPPWGRTPVDPGGRSCEIRVSWEHLSVEYPAVLDPAWTTTGTMAVGRSSFEPVVLADGRVLVAGGGTVLEPSASVEVYDPPTGTWATGPSLAAPRFSNTTTVLGDGRVIVAGGASGSATMGTTEIYDTVRGAWSLGPPLNQARTHHHATLLVDGRVLVAGGGSGFAMLRPEALRADQSTWDLIPSTEPRREYHSQTLLTDGRVLLAGGEPNAVASSTTIFEPKTSSFTAGPGLGENRRRHAAVLLPSGEVLIVGGGTLRSADILDVPSGSLRPLPPIPQTTMGSGAVSLAGGKVLIAGGWQSFSEATTNAHVFDVATETWAFASRMFQPRAFPGVVRLPDGAALVAGGRFAVAESAGNIRNAELFVLQPLAAPCEADGQCSSQSCEDGICCATPCGGDVADCRACTQAQTGEPDGTCALALAGSICRPAYDEADVGCDPEEVCDGTLDTCPDNVTEEFGIACGDPGATICSGPDFCNGAGNCNQNHYTLRDCLEVVDPADYDCFSYSACDIGVCRAFEPILGGPCRQPAGPCDVFDTCDGEGHCSIDLLAAAGAVVAECNGFTCNGVAADCPTVCSAPGDCAPGFLCEGGSCEPRDPATTSSGGGQGGTGGDGGGGQVVSVSSGGGSGGGAIASASSGGGAGGRSGAATASSSSSGGAGGAGGDASGTQSATASATGPTAGPGGGDPSSSSATSAVTSASSTSSASGSAASTNASSGASGTSTTTTTTASAAGGGEGGGSTAGTVGDGCGCRTASPTSPTGRALPAAAALLLLLGRRRRRSGDTSPPPATR